MDQNFTPNPGNLTAEQLIYYIAAQVTRLSDDIENLYAFRDKVNKNISDCDHTIKMFTKQVETVEESLARFKEYCKNNREKKLDPIVDTHTKHNISDMDSKIEKLEKVIKSLHEGLKRISHRHLQEDEEKLERKKSIKKIVFICFEKFVEKVIFGGIVALILYYAIVKFNLPTPSISP